LEDDKNRHQVFLKFPAKEDYKYRVFERSFLETLAYIRYSLE
jgi:hypothetical protein